MSTRWRSSSSPAASEVSGWAPLGVLCLRLRQERFRKEEDSENAAPKGAAFCHRDPRTLSQGWYLQQMQGNARCAASLAASRSLRPGVAPSST